jgi:hypothetical protein
VGLPDGLSTRRLAFAASRRTAWRGALKAVAGMKQVRRWFVSAATLIAAFAVSPPSAQSAVEGPDADIFAVLLPGLARNDGGSNYVVDETPLGARKLSDAEWQWLGPRTAALRAVSETLAAVPVGPFDSASFPPRVTLITRDVAQKYQRAEEAVWVQFRDEFKTRSLWRFSRPVITDDGLDALVWSAQACGSMCGRTDVHWLHRVSRSDPWTIAKSLPKGIS